MRKLKLEELGRLSVSEFKDHPKIPVSILLDNIRSAHNVGAAFRTADAFLVEKIYLCGITSRPPHRDIRKSALGAEESVDWEYYENPLDVIEKKKEEGYRVVSMEQADGSTSLEGFQPDPKQPYLVIFGNEVEGVSESVFNESDLCLEITQFGSKHSLNVSVSIGICLWKFSQVFNKP